MLGEFVIRYIKEKAFVCISFTENPLLTPDFSGLIVYKDGSKIWFQNGKIHREDGPAVKYPNGDKEYWVNGFKQLNVK